MTVDLSGRTSISHSRMKNKSMLILCKQREILYAHAEFMPRKADGLAPSQGPQPPAQHHTPPAGWSATVPASAGALLPCPSDPAVPGQQHHQRHQLSLPAPAMPLPPLPSHHEQLQLQERHEGPRGPNQGEGYNAHGDKALPLEEGPGLDAFDPTVPSYLEPEQQWHPPVAASAPQVFSFEQQQLQPQQPYSQSPLHQQQQQGPHGQEPWMQQHPYPPSFPMPQPQRRQQQQQPLPAPPLLPPPPPQQQQQRHKRPRSPDVRSGAPHEPSVGFTAGGANNGGAARQWRYYHILRWQATANHILFYLVDEHYNAELAVVGTDLRFSGHFVYSTLPECPVAGQPLRCTNRNRVMDWLAAQGAVEAADTARLHIPPLRPHELELLESSDPLYSRPPETVLDRQYVSWREEVSVLPDGRHMKQFWLVAAPGRVDCPDRLVVTAEDSHRRDRRYAYRALPEFGGFVFENGSCAKASAVHVPDMMVMGCAEAASRCGCRGRGVVGLHRWQAIQARPTCRQDHADLPPEDCHDPGARVAPPALAPPHAEVSRLLAVRPLKAPCALTLQLAARRLGSSSGGAAGAAGSSHSATAVAAAISLSDEALDGGDGGGGHGSDRGGGSGGEVNFLAAAREGPLPCWTHQAAKLPPVQELPPVADGSAWTATPYSSVPWSAPQEDYWDPPVAARNGPLEGWNQAAATTFLRAETETTSVPDPQPGRSEPARLAASNASPHFARQPSLLPVHASPQDGLHAALDPPMFGEAEPPPPPLPPPQPQPQQWPVGRHRDPWQDWDNPDDHEPDQQPQRQHALAEMSCLPPLLVRNGPQEEDAAEELPGWATQASNGNGERGRTLSEGGATPAPDLAAAAMAAPTATWSCLSEAGSASFGCCQMFSPAPKDDSVSRSPGYLMHAECCLVPPDSEPDFDPYTAPDVRAAFLRFPELLEWVTSIPSRETAATFGFWAEKLMAFAESAAAAATTPCPVGVEPGSTVQMQVQDLVPDRGGRHKDFHGAASHMEIDAEIDESGGGSCRRNAGSDGGGGGNSSMDAEQVVGILDKIAEMRLSLRLCLMVSDSITALRCCGNSVVAEAAHRVAAAWQVVAQAALGRASEALKGQMNAAVIGQDPESDL
ncbi:hypothetical protein VOLCADRAFT_86702 [Volvox carteri f. nagariensis]|uniref:Uncharacterized protein n=1 Tax=Volvox carteri f. nagariensis TaxID=3068 RepID=D8TJD5_VOLCA|nr:uncharacterized protein VOLCADRAFT_86702 [Volvox carteri f. nagariensis]EFJ52353.1 hypothetical protein VOLCADRAFT_86702 [Volvox carteri f. nagariensis]|eukprot:XP_002946426.1 hypothetical protein VOLCADRAFT_86702 [Volvox carteri f. nagariensis]